MDKLINLFMTIIQLFKNYLYLINSFIMRSKIDILVMKYHPPPRTLCSKALRKLSLPKTTSALIIKSSLINKLGAE
jgi:hypothetical protein